MAKTATATLTARSSQETLLETLWSARRRSAREATSSELLALRSASVRYCEPLSRSGRSRIQARSMGRGQSFRAREWAVVRVVFAGL